MESNSFRSSSVLNDVDTNVQELVKRSSPLSASKSTKNSSISSDEIEYDDITNDQENKPPGSVESASSTDSFKFKKPPPRELMSKDDNSLNSLIDGLSHLKLGSSSVAAKRFNSSKWTTPLKKKSAQSSESRASSDCSFEKNSPPSALNDEEIVENVPVADSSNNPDKETSIIHNDDDCSDYYDCEEVNVISDNTADSSFHSVPEKEHAALTAGNSESVNQANLAEMNQTQYSDQAYILEKYLTEQDFKLEISLNDISFNTMGDGLDFELGKPQNVCSQTENPISGALFSFENEEKAKFCSIVNLNVNDVTIQPDQFNNMDLFAKENDRQNEDALFNVLSECSIQNETRSMFDTNPEENIFALGRLSQAGFLRINTVEEEDALIQDSARRSPQLQVNDLNSDPNDVNESEENNVQVQSVPMQMNADVEIASENMEIDDDVSMNENISNQPSFSYPQQTNSGQFSFSFTVTDHSDEVETTDENSTSVLKTTEIVEVEHTSMFEESLVANEPSSNTNPKAITTIDEIFSEMNKNSKKLEETIELPERTPSPSSLDATMDTDSICDDSFSEKPNLISDFESSRSTELGLEQSTNLPKLNPTADLEASRNFSLEIEGRSSNITVNFEEIQTAEDMTRETNIEQSPNREMQRDCFDSETSLESVINLSEKSGESLANLTTNSETTDVKVDNSSSDLKKSNDISTAVENLTEECQDLAAVIGENTSRSEDVELNELVNSKSTSMIIDEFLTLDETRLKPMKTVGLNLDITQIVNKEITNYEDGTENDQRSSEISNNEMFDQSSSDLNNTVAPEVGEKPLDEESRESLANSATNSEITDVKVGDSSSDLNQSNDISTAFENISIQCQGSAAVINESSSRSKDEELNESATSKSTSTITDEFLTLDKTRLKPIKTVGLNLDITQIVDKEITKYEDGTENDLGTSEVKSSSGLNNTVMLEIGEKPFDDSFSSIRIPSKQNETINLEITRVIDENVAETSDNLNETAQLEPKMIENTSEIVQEQSYLNDTMDVEVIRKLEEKTDDLINSDQQTTTIEISSSELVQKSFRLNETVDMEVTQTFEENPSTAIEANSAAFIQKPSRLNETVVMEVIRMAEENFQDFVDSDKLNQTVDLLIDPSVSIQNSPELNKTADSKTISPTYEDTVPYSPETVTLEYDPDADTKMDEIATVLPIFSTESILKNSSTRLEITKDDMTPATTFTSNLNYDDSIISMETEINEESVVGLSNLPEDQPNEQELLDGSISNTCDDTVIIHETPDRRCNSPARFDRYAALMPEPASPIPPNSPIELTNKWRTHFDLSSVTDQLESYTGRDSPPNSSDEMDVTDPVDSNIAPEMLQISKLPPGINRSISNLESIPEMNEADLTEEQNTSGDNLKQDTKDEQSLEVVNATRVELKPEAVLNQTVASTSSVDRDNGNESSPTVTQTSPEPKLESGLNISIAAVPSKLNDSIFKTPIAIKSLPRSDLSALNDSNFNADYFCARTASAKSQSRNSLVSPKSSSFKNTPIFSPFTPTRRLIQGTPKPSGNILSLLDMSIGCFENYTANQPRLSTVPDNELNKTVDADEKPRVEETKLLCLDDPHKKINVKTQTHDTELIDLQAENAKLKEDLKGFIEIAEALAHNEAELKKTVLQLEDNNRILNNKYGILTEYSNQLLARRNAELDVAEEKIRVLEAQLQEYTKKTKASSK